MKCLLTYLFVLCISWVVPQAGDFPATIPRFIFPSDDNGDPSKPVSAFVQEAGFAFEEHKVRTTDGYILTLWRIFRKDKLKGYPVILQHGILDNGYTFLLAGPRNSFALYLARKGYDVWISNSRGQTFSLEHDEKYWWFNPFSKYWDFSFHEMGVYDFPAIVEHVKQITGLKKVNYVAHSQGATHYFVKGSFDPDYINENIETFVGIGPAMFVQPHTSTFVNNLAEFRVFDALYSVGANNFMVLPENILAQFESICRNYPSLYYEVVPRISGYTKKSRFNIKRWPTLCAKLPGGTSAKCLLHWMQIIRSGEKFQMFDYGAEKNMEKYNQTTPKEYNTERLKLIKVPTLLLIGTSDGLISEHGVQKILKLLKNDDKDQVLELVKLDDYSHMDYTWGVEAIKDVYPQIERFLKRNLKKAI